MPSHDPANPYLADAAIALLASLQDRLLDIQARDFPTKTPSLFADSLRELVRAISATLTTPQGETTLKFCLILLKRIGSHLRYIESASAERIPWGLISPIERMLKRVVPDSSAMVRTRWSYNYSIVELYDAYRKALASLLSGKVLEEIFGDPKHKFFIVSAPQIERDNILLHLVLGHEIGHRIADVYLSAEDKAKLLLSVTAVVGDGKWYDPDIEKDGPLFALQRRQWLTSKVLEIRQRGLEEIISDLAGMYIFGPACLFALNEFAYEDILDDPPAGDQYYPPWRYRFRQCLRVFDEMNSSQLGTFIGKEPPGPQVQEAYEAQIRYLREIAENKEDLQIIQTGDPLVKRAYDEIERALTGIPPFIRTRLAELTYDPIRAKDDFQILLRRLASGIPPNEGANGTADFRSALTVGWLLRLAKVPIPFKPDATWGHEHDLRLCRLVHKAIEYIEVSDEYKTWKNGRAK